ncbi:ATP-binding cassette domain-containing protein [Streptomyces albidoflavus]|uniref:ATP-binding cassette domain-containing protein n=1 Tax=Streptomyces albidoflavus TaxID=1886 RepID=UPI00188A2C39|nr:ATP-binding cassette domain-containing protein [Streptomyces albidoflavus]
MEAARASGAGTVLAALPQGLDTSLARSWWGGHDLSGGQWQRLALARSFHTDAPVHILDEPTAALDARAEHHVLQRFRALTDARAGPHSGPCRRRRTTRLLHHQAHRTPCPRGTAGRRRPRHGHSAPASQR